jgi:hypothetical protein
MSVNLMMQDCLEKGSETLTTEEIKTLKAILSELKKMNGKLHYANSCL